MQIPWLSLAWVRTEALADLGSRLSEEVKPRVGRDGACHVCFLKSLLSTAGEAGMAPSVSKTIPAEFEQLLSSLSGRHSKESFLLLLGFFHSFLECILCTSAGSFSMGILTASLHLPQCHSKRKAC